MTANISFIMQHQAFKVETLANPEKVELIVGDLFAGAGGVGEGFENVFDNEGNRKIVVAFAVNHNENAIRSHQLNHPHTNHYIEDVRTLDVYPLVKLIDAYKKVYVNAKFMLWASAPCQEHSIAKAGQPLDIANRTLPNDILRYIDILKPDRIGIENVRLFKDWGPLMAAKKKTYMDVEYPYTELKMHKCKKEGIDRITYKVIPERKGEHFRKWRKDILSFGYIEDWIFLNAADVGAYTSRDRLFGQFCKPDLPIRWPEPTHNKKGTGSLKKWKAAKDIIDTHILGESIFNRKKRLSPNTIGKILAEIKKTVKRGHDWHIHKYYGSGINMTSKEDPIGTLRRKDCMYYIKMIFSNHGTSSSSSLDSPIPAIQTNPKSEFLSYIYDGSFGGSMHTLDRPVRTIVASQGKAPLEKMDLLKGNFDTNISNFLTKEDIHFINTGEGEKSVYLEMVEFCVENGIRDIFKRGLSIKELLLAQGFPSDYKFYGTQTEAKEFIGNSVSPDASMALGYALCI